MANLAFPVNVYPAGSGYLSQYVIGQCATQSSGNTKVHIKLDLPKTSSYGTMVMIEAIGFAYGSGQAIRCSWTFYQYNSLLYSVGTANVYPGMTADAVYFSSDNFVCLRGSVASYFTGFVLNAYVNAGDGYGKKITLNNADWNTNAGNFF